MEDRLGREPNGSGPAEAGRRCVCECDGKYFVGKKKAV